MSSLITRRELIASTAATALAAPMVARQAKPGDKLNIAVIGVNNRGAANLAGVAHENIVALCDVDEDWSAKSRDQYPNAAFYTDYRRMFDKMAKEIDAVVVSTPDHTHALPACIAMSHGKHVYCEKPMAETVNEVQAMRKLAASKKLVTQMGTQIHAGENYRRVVEIVRSGLLGEINKVWVWNSSKPVGGKRLGAKPSAKFDIDLWMGPTTGEFFEVQLNKSNWNYAWPHFHWRWWWEFGGGTLADLGCHYIDLPYWALELTSPTAIVAKGEKNYSGDNNTPDVMRVDYQFRLPLTGKTMELTWQHGVAGPGDRPDIHKSFSSGIRFDGTKGQLVADYTKFMLLPEAFAKDFQAPPKSIEKSIGHHKEWTEAIKNGKSTTCNFEYAGRLAECVLLGNVTYRGHAIKWDAKAGSTGTRLGDGLLTRADRKGWELPRA